MPIHPYGGGGAAQRERVPPQLTKFAKTKSWGMMKSMEASPEVKAILKDYCRKKEAELGPNWKEIEAKRMAEQTTAALGPFLTALKKISAKN